MAPFVALFAGQREIVGMIAAAIGSPLQVLDRGRVWPLLIAPPIGKDDMPVAIATATFLLSEQDEDVSSFH
ncbi:hypothetical protein ACVINI_000336 [Rhizobium beringeri]